MKKEFRLSSLEERKKFYKKFSIPKLVLWFKKNNLRLPQLCAIDAGTETGIILNKKNKGKILYFKFSELKGKIKEYLPEDLYYDRSVYNDPDKILRTLKFNNWKEQELVFDVDVDNLKEGKLNKHCLNQAYKNALEIKKLLKKEGYKKVLIIYSGRGFHVHVLDKKGFLLKIKERKALNKKFSKYGIDEWVSAGNMRLIRMPFSLNGRVNKKVIPIKSKFY